jgi:protein O-GlcNAc transferase
MSRGLNIPVRKPPIAMQVKQASPEVAKLLEEGILLHRQGKLENAKIVYESILKTQNNNFNAMQLLGMIYNQQKKFSQSLKCFDLALKINKNHAALYNNRGIALKELGRLEESLESFDRALRLKAGYADAFNNRGITLKEMKRFDEALKSFDCALQLKSDYAEAFNNRGNTLKDMNCLDEAVKSFEKALQIKSNYADAYNNLGNVFNKLNRYNEALKCFDLALNITPLHVNALNNRGNTLRGLRRFSEALRHYDAALNVDPLCSYAHYNRGLVLHKLNHFDEAIRSQEHALQINPDYINAKINLIYAMQDAAFWDHRLTDLYSVDDNKTNSSLSHFNLFRLQSIPGLSASQVVKISSDHLNRKIENISPLRQSLGFPPSPVLKDKINLGFLSMDLRDHVVMRLLSGFFESINRDKFRLFAYSYGVDDKSELRKKAETSFDVFRDVRTVSDEQIAKQIAEDEVHILIDLAGHTADNRLEITLLKPAPITVHMFSDAGTLGKGAVDYKIIDTVIAVKDIYHEQYAESLILTPPGIAFDNRIAPPAPDTRLAHGLPDDVFVFCSFNQIYKINPPLFDCWMQILREVPDSVLWLWADDLGVQRRLKAEAASRGVDESRLVFAKKVPLSSHYARTQLADLALDTFPYGSHSTGADALWCGVPLLGFTGETPASRVSTCHLTACGLPELSIEGGYEAYAQAAIGLAKDRQRLASIRQKLIKTIRPEVKMKSFSTNGFVKVFEAAMEQVWRRHEQGLPVETFQVKL